MLIDSEPKPRRFHQLHEQRRWDSPAALFVCGLAGSVAIGLATTEHGKYVVVALLAVCLAGIALRWPRATIILALVSFVWDAQGIVPGLGNYPQAQKLLILFAGLVIARRRGFRLDFAAPLFAYLTLVVFTELGSTKAVGLTLYQTFLSLLTLTVCWVTFAIRWRRSDVTVILKTIVWLPLACVALGVLLNVGHQWKLIDTASSPPRLQGALIAPYLAAAAAAATVAAIMLTRVNGWRYGPSLTVINAVVLALTVTRGAMIAGGFALIPSVVRLARAWIRVRTPAELLRLLVVAAIAVAVIVFVASQVATRDDQSIFVPGQGEIKGDASSGRTAAWAFAYAAAKANLVFGRGLGAAPVIGAQYQHFLAQHNEYLRMLLEGGYVGGIVVLLSIAGVIALAIHRSPPCIRADLAFFAIGVAFYSFTDNTLSNPQFGLPMTLIFALGAALGIRGSVPTVRTQPPSKPPALSTSRYQIR
jgi:O-antigen ligase